MEINKELLNKLFEQAKVNPRLRQGFDLRTSPSDTSQRMLNALLPGTVVPIHRHEDTAETVICLCGKLDEVIYEEVDSQLPSLTGSRFREIEAHSPLSCPNPIWLLSGSERCVAHGGADRAECDI